MNGLMKVSGKRQIKQKNIFSADWLLTSRMWLGGEER